MQREITKLKKTKKSPSAREQKRAFAKASAEMSRTRFGELTSTANSLLVSNGAKKSVGELFDALVMVSESYPLDVVAFATLAFAGNSYAGYLAFLALEREK